MQEPTYVHASSSSTPSRGRVAEVPSKPKKLMVDAQKFYFRPEEISKGDLCLFQNIEDRVQGVSGENI
jgi:hypothetical protein